MADSPLVENRRRARRARERSLALATEARRRLRAERRDGGVKRRGRVWINGRELGAQDGRFAHLSASYD